MHNNKNYHFKHNHVTNPLLAANVKQNNEVQNNFKMGNNFHDPKRYNEQNNHQKLNQQNLGLKQNQRKNNFEDNNKNKKTFNDNINQNNNHLSNNLRNNSKLEKVNINLNNNYNSGGNFEIYNKSQNFNVTKNKFLMNFNLPNLINTQDRVINFGQDKSENNFKKTLRKGASNLIQNSSFNIINNNPSVNNAFNNSVI